LYLLASYDYSTTFMYVTLIIVSYFAIVYIVKKLLRYIIM